MDALLKQSASVLNQNRKGEETDASTTPKRGDRSPSPLDNQDTQAGIVMTEKKDTDKTSEVYRPKSSVGSKSKVALHEMASTELNMTEQQK